MGVQTGQRPTFRTTNVRRSGLLLQLGDNSMNPPPFERALLGALCIQ